MKNRNTGSILVLALAGFAMLFVATIFFVDLSRASYLKEKAQIVADESLKAALATRAEGLEAAAAKAAAVSPFIRDVDSGGAAINSADWAALQKAALDTKNALPGYKGRIKSAMTVVMKANEYGGESTVLDAAGLDLGLSSEKQRVRDEKGRSSTVDGLWIRRLWAKRDVEADRTGSSELQVVFPFHWMLHWAPEDFTSVKANATAKLLWDVRTDLKAVTTSDGGFPFAWSEADVDGKFAPYRHSMFAGVLRDSL